MSCGRTSRRCARPNAAPRSRGSAPHDERVLRRLAVAAREGRTWGVLWRRPGQQAIATAAPLRLALAPQERRLAVRVLKRRGGDVAQPVLIDVDPPPHCPIRARATADRCPSRSCHARALNRDLLDR